jgi:hypothetical protein
MFDLQFWEFKMRMRKRYAIMWLAMAVAMNLGASAQADVVDFMDGNFTMIQNSGINDAPTIFSESVLGATVTFESVANLVGGTGRFVGLEQGVTSNGLHLGGGGGSTLEFTISSSQDIQLVSYATDGGGFFLNPPTFDIAGLGASSVGNSLDPGDPANLIAGGPVTLLAGEVYTFDVQNTGATVQAFVSSMEFTAVPEPGSMSVLLVVGLAAGLVRRRRLAFR